MRIKFILPCSVILLIIITSIYSNASQNKEVKGVQTVKKINVINSSPSPTLSPTSAPVSNSKIQTVAKKDTDKLYGGWYWNSELNRSQRWMGKDSQSNDIWSDQGDAPPASQNNTSENTSTQSSSNNSSSLQPSELGATLAPQQYSVGTQQTKVGVSVSSQNMVCYRDGREPKCP